jgi:DNA primase
LNVEELLQSKDISYIPKGGDYEIRCLNPEHEDRHPSLRIDRITGIFNCFSCGFKGNLFNHYGEKVNRLQMRRELLKKKINNKRAESIGITFPVDNVPYTGDWRGISPETYERFEAFQNHESEYIGRIIFPIRNLSGKIAAFVGRHTTGGVPKYLISPAGARLPLFPVVKPILGTVILVEGIYDMINLHDKGLTNTVCCFGTQNINEDKLAMLRMQGAETIFVFFDGDDAGQNAAEHVQSMCARIEMPSRNIELKGTDPGALSTKSVETLKRKLYT